MAEMCNADKVINTISTTFLTVPFEMVKKTAIAK